MTTKSNTKGKQNAKVQALFIPNVGKGEQARGRASLLLVCCSWRCLYGGCPHVVECGAQ